MDSTREHPMSKARVVHLTQPFPKYHSFALHRRLHLAKPGAGRRILIVYWYFSVSVQKSADIIATGFGRGERLYETVR